MSRNLLIYYSLTGLNDSIVKIINQEKDTDIVKLKPKVAYPKGMYNCWDKVRAWRGVGDIPEYGQPLVNLDKVPAIEKVNVDLAKYSNLIIGGPVWGWTMSDPIIAFLNTANLTGKNIKAYWTCVNTDYNYEHDFKKLIVGNNYQGGLTIDASLANDSENLKLALKRFLEK